MRLPDSETSSSPCNQSESRAPFSGRCTSHNIAARFLLPLTPKCCSFKQTKQNTLKRLLNESHTWLEEMSKRRTWELQEEFDRDEKMRLEESQQQRNDLEARHAAETQELKDQIYGLMHKTTKYSKAAACADPKPEFAETALLLRSCHWDHDSQPATVPPAGGAGDVCGRQVPVDPEAVPRSRRI